MGMKLRKVLVWTVILVLMFSMFSFSVSEDDMWTCPNCGKDGLMRNFCPSCGTARPEDPGIPFEYEIGDIVAFTSQEYSDDVADKLVWAVAAIDGEMVVLVCVSALPETVALFMDSGTPEDAADYAKYLLSKKPLSGEEADVIDQKGILELSDSALYPELPVKKSGNCLVLIIESRKIVPFLTRTEYTETEPEDDIPAELIEGTDYLFVDDGRPILLRVEETRKEQYICKYARLIDEFIKENCADGDWAELTSGDESGFSGDTVRLTEDSTEEEIRAAIGDALKKGQFPIECKLYQAENLLTLSVDCRIRKGAGLSYETLDILPAGEQVYRVASVDSSDGTWYEIRYKGGKAYLSSSSFENKKPAAASHVTSSPRPTQTVITPKPTSPVVVTPTPAPSATIAAHTHKYKYIYKDSTYHNRTCSICGYIKEQQKHDKECKIISGNSEQHLVVCSECGQELYYANHTYLYNFVCIGCNYINYNNN